MWLQIVEEEKAVKVSRLTESQTPSCQGLALASTSLAATKQLVDPKAKPWGDDRVWGIFRAFMTRTA